MTSRVLVVAAAVVDDLDHPRRLLAARRLRPTALAGRWEFPGGKVDDDDQTPADALHREILEELGVRVALGAQVPAPDGGDWPVSDRYVLRLWAAAVLDGVPTPQVEHDAVRWLEPGSWFDVPWLDADVPIVSALLLRVGSAAGLR